MTTWRDFETNVKAKDPFPWGIGQGQALWTTKDGSRQLYVRIYVPLETLDIDAERLRLSASDEDVIFEVQSISEKGVNHPDDSDIVDIIRPYISREDFKVLSPPPTDYQAPAKLQWTPTLYRKFKKTRISKTRLASLWGQHIDYFDYPITEFNAWGGEDYNHDIGVLFRQEWVKKMECPFCGHDDWNSTLSCQPREPEREFYNSSRRLIFCPKCERAVEVL